MDAALVLAGAPRHSRFDGCARGRRAFAPEHPHGAEGPRPEHEVRGASTLSRQRTWTLSEASRPSARVAAPFDVLGLLWLVQNLFPIAVWVLALLFAGLAGYLWVRSATDRTWSQTDFCG